MSIEQRNKIAELERRVATLEQQINELLSLAPKVSGEPSLQKTGTLTLPEKRKSA